MIRIKKVVRILLVTMVVMNIFILSGCSNKNEVKNTINNYTKLLNEKNYDELYENLTTDSKDYIK